MKFTKLVEIMDSQGVKSLAEIARTLKTTPQAVSNWKARDQVPYHIVDLLNKIVLISDEEKHPTYETRTQPNPFVSKLKKDKEFTISDILLIFAEQIKVIFLVSFISVFFTFTYVRFIQEPKYVSSATVLLPQQVGSNMGGIAGIASQFGVNVPSGVKTDLSSPQLLPDLLRSRTFAENILDKTFYTRKFDKKLSLLAILTHGNNSPLVGRDTLITRASNKLRNILEFDLDLTSAISKLKVTTNEPIFSKELAEITLAELENLNRFYKSQTVNEKINFILNRIISVENDLELSEKILKEFNERNRQISSPSLQLELDRLTRLVEVQKGIYLTLKQQYELAKIEEVQEASIVQILDKPQVPLMPSNKNLSQAILASTFIGLMLGALFGFLRYFLDRNDIDERKKIRRVKHFIKKKTKDIFYDIRISRTLTFLLFLGMPIYLGYRSDNPTYFGMYSTKIMIFNTIYVLAFIIFLMIYIRLSRKK